MEALSSMALTLESERTELSTKLLQVRGAIAQLQRVYEVVLEIGDSRSIVGNRPNGQHEMHTPTRRSAGMRSVEAEIGATRGTAAENSARTLQMALSSPLPDSGGRGRANWARSTHGNEMRGSGAQKPDQREAPAADITQRLQVAKQSPLPGGARSMPSANADANTQDIGGTAGDHDLATDRGAGDGIQKFRMRKHGKVLIRWRPSGMRERRERVRERRRERVKERRRERVKRAREKEGERTREKEGERASAVDAEKLCGARQMEKTRPPSEKTPMVRSTMTKSTMTEITMVSMVVCSASQRIWSRMGTGQLEATAMTLKEHGDRLTMHCDDWKTQRDDEQPG